MIALIKKTETPENVVNSKNVVQLFSLKNSGNKVFILLKKKQGEYSLPGVKNTYDLKPKIALKKKFFNNSSSIVIGDKLGEFTDCSTFSEVFKTKDPIPQEHMGWVDKNGSYEYFNINEVLGLNIKPITKEAVMKHLKNLQASNYN